MPELAQKKTCFFHQTLDTNYFLKTVPDSDLRQTQYKRNYFLLQLLTYYSGNWHCRYSQQEPGNKTLLRLRSTSQEE